MPSKSVQIYLDTNITTNSSFPIELALSTFLKPITTIDSDDLWHPIVFDENSSRFFENFPPFLNFANVKNANLSSENVSESENRTLTVNGETVKVVSMVLTAVVLGFIILSTIIGNVFVIAAILLERNLQNIANYLILSLAVADLLVACLVMPLGAIYEVSQEWRLGPELCEIWTSSDVLCCTASILHLVAIALDRYWAVTNIDYIHQRTTKRIGLMILIIWLLSFFVCIAPLLGWKDANWEIRVRDKKCVVSQDLFYQVFATASSFYLPLLVILILYWRIFQTARKRIRRRTVCGKNDTGGAAGKSLAAGGIAGGLAAASGTGGIAAAVVTIIGRPLPTISETTTTAFTNISSTNSSPEKKSTCANGFEPDFVTARKPRKTRTELDAKREKKAAKTLAIITGAFVLCWLPFFILAVLLPINPRLFDDKLLVSACLWLGYFNSTLNPIIYTVFSPEFRHVFKKILCGKNYARRNRRFGGGVVAGGRAGGQ